MATLLEADHRHRPLTRWTRRCFASKPNIEYAGVPCGIMDQFISVMGRKDHLLLLDCRSRKTELVPMRDPSVSLLITNTNVKHELGSGQYAKRRAQCEAAAKILGVASLRDATAAALEQAKAAWMTSFSGARAMSLGKSSAPRRPPPPSRASDWSAAGQLMYASHCSLRDDYEVSCAELDAVVEIARAIGASGGVYGCRMTGGGFGGCAVALVKTDAVDAISKKIAADYKQQNRNCGDHVCFPSRRRRDAAQRVSSQRRKAPVKESRFRHKSFAG